MSSDVDSLAHTKWNCKYHIVFAPKYRRRQVIYEKLIQDMGKNEDNYVREKTWRLLRWKDAKTTFICW